MKKLVISLCVIISAFLLFILGCLVYYKIILPRTEESDPDNWSSVDYLMNEADVKIYFYGDQLKIPKNLVVDNIDSLDMEALDMDHDYVYMFINDWKSSTEVTNEDAKVLVEFADAHNNFNFVYIGNKAFDSFKKYIRNLQVTQDDLSFSYIVDEGTRMCSYGGFVKSDLDYIELNDYMPMDGILLIMYSDVKRNNTQ